MVPPVYPSENLPVGKIERGQQLKRDGIVIRTWDLRKTYIMGDQEIHAVSGIDIEIKKGEYVAIMGPSGSGKSTPRESDRLPGFAHFRPVLSERQLSQ